MEKLLYLFALIVVAFACQPEEFQSQIPEPSPYNFPVLANFPPVPEPDENPTTLEGVALGRKLFFDPVLSGDNTMSCSSCHTPGIGFTDSTAVSVGIDGIGGKRNSMSLVNLAYAESFFWDGRSPSLEAQALDPVTDPIELHEEWPNAVAEIKGSQEYQALFLKAFGDQEIDRNLVAKAIAQFERTLISGNSRFDQFLRGEENLTPSELNGFNIYNTEKGDCFHCHGPILFTDHLFHNNGLDSVFSDSGRAKVTGIAADLGKFKTPSLRNIEVSGPYMHDGRFETLEEVIEHYNSGGKPSATIDPLMKNVGTGLGLSPQEKADLKAFLLTLTDEEYLNNSEFQDPN